MVENVFPKEGKSREEKLKVLEDWKVKLIPEKHFKDIPLEVLTYFQYIKMTNVTQFPFPDYEFLKKLFKQILQRLGVQEKDFYFDWVGVF